ncbi:Leptin receptor overlapping transcript-like 1 [Cryptotermes secundus]|uniref:Leptin receptor overlapping transcript-like 1 n=1 Tax=Cryptotermes secundus TaxID=105785 RepID=A0A2J7R5F5_9NEOP|nr:Leptin receptor overlapping transcript-like 1 [Cryptotermes secundus]
MVYELERTWEQLWPVSRDYSNWCQGQENRVAGLQAKTWDVLNKKQEQKPLDHGIIVWWTFFVVLFYVLAPLPTLIARRHAENSGSSSTAAYEFAIFITMGFVVSSFALPIVLARSPESAPVIKWGACYLTLAGNVVVYATLLGFFMTFDAEDTDYSMW